jgi:hypothetical protein
MHRTTQHRTKYVSRATKEFSTYLVLFFSLHNLSVRLIDASALASAPLPAAQRIEHRPFLSMMKSQWNNQVETLFRGVGDLNQKATTWGRRTLYGEHPKTEE